MATFQTHIVPKTEFSFHDWCYGYIFQQLYQLSKHQYGNAYYIYDDSDLWLINALFEENSSSNRQKPIDVSLNYYRQDSPEKFQLQEDPSDEIEKLATQTLNHYLGFKDDLTGFYKFTSEFDELRALPKVLPGYRLASVLMREWMPVLAYLSTNTTVDMYHTFLANFLINWGLKTTFQNFSMASFPPLKQLIHLKDEDYRKTKIGYRSKYLPELINSLATNNSSVLSNTFTLEQEDLPKILKQLKKLKGIGDYSARCILLYGHKEYSVGFVDSIVKIIMNQYFGIDKSLSNTALMKKIDDKFSPYQGLLIDWLCAIYSFTTNSSKDKFF